MNGANEAKQEKLLILVRRDDSDYKVELVRWQVWLHGFWGYTRSMLINHRTPCLFPKSVWREEGEVERWSAHTGRN